MKSLIFTILMLIPFYLFAESNIERIYYPSGKIMIEIQMQNGVRNGTFSTFYESGVLQSETNYRDGILEGSTKLYFENGTLKIEYDNKAGYRDGIYKRYNTDGKLCFSAIYKSGKIVSGKDSDGKNISNDDLKFIQEGVYNKCK